MPMVTNGGRPLAGEQNRSLARVTGRQNRPLAGERALLAAIGGPLAGVALRADRLCTAEKAEKEQLGNMITKLAQPNPAASGCMLTIIKTTGLVGRTPRPVIVPQTLMIRREPGP